MNKLGDMTNSIRETMKCKTKDEFIDSVVHELNAVSSMYPVDRMTHEISACNFTGFTLISTMLSATENSEVTPEKKLVYVETVVRLVMPALIASLGGQEDGQKTN